MNNRDNFEGRIFENLNNRAGMYENIDIDSNIFKKYQEKVEFIFKNRIIRDWILEPFADVFKRFEKLSVPQIIFIASIVNMILAGIPGKLGAGVIISMAVELTMAYYIAKDVGLGLKKDDIFKTVIAGAGSILMVVFGFRQILNIIFSILTLFPAFLPITAISEFFATTIVGVTFWVAFEEMKKSGKFSLPKNILFSFVRKFKSMLKVYKGVILKINVKNIKTVGKRIKDYFTGDIVIPKNKKEETEVISEMISLAGISMILNNEIDKMKVPYRDLFLESVRRAYPEQLGDASINEIRDFFQHRTASQIIGDMNLLRGEINEHLVERLENFDGDSVFFKLNDDRTVPGYDGILYDTDSHYEIPISLKNTISTEYIEHSLEKYPNIKIMANEEVANYFDDDPRVIASSVSYDDVTEINEKNFDALINGIHHIDTLKVAGASVVFKATAMLWPFFMAYMNKKISKKQFDTVCKKVFGKSVRMTVPRIGYAMILSPVFAWYLLARSVINVMSSIILFDDKNLKQKEN